MLKTYLHNDPALRKRITVLQVSIWTIFYIFLLLYTLQKWEYPKFGFWAATIATIAYFFAVYSNAHWLIPNFYKRGKKVAYLSLSVIILAVLQLVRMYAEYRILLPLHLKFYSWTLSHFSFVFITNFLAFAFGALLRVSIDYLSLLQRQQEMKTRQLSTELNLLKAQVQPHFLFNTLNNIYYLAYTKSDHTAEVIAKLSEIMRYFVDEAPKEKVPLSTEIQFLKNYIELEQIRMLHPVKAKFMIEADESILLPPMLLIPLVENIFKHGVDKTVEENNVAIKLKRLDQQLVFSTCNQVGPALTDRQNGAGLMNLRKRLAILYGDNFELTTSLENGNFKASLKFSV
ncbi:sensor histidine kinase [Terrimonas alba]|uniref:sensor histidine kinase n=1 Tax=Terrimonas alba TaxID=3349636 RepID=UPI0035F23CA3